MDLDLPRNGRTRRRFITTAGITTAAAVCPAIIPAAALGRNGATAPSERIVMGAIGVGGRGSGDLRVLLGRKDVQVVAVCDIDAKRLARARKTVDDTYKNRDCAAYLDMRACQEFASGGWPLRRAWGRTGGRGKGGCGCQEFAFGGRPLNQPSGRIGGRGLMDGYSGRRPPAAEKSPVSPSVFWRATSMQIPASLRPPDTTSARMVRIDSIDPEPYQGAHHRQLPPRTTRFHGLR